MTVTPVAGVSSTDLGSTLEPPDTTVAVSTCYLVEMVNTAMLVITRSNMNRAMIDLNTWFGIDTPGPTNGGIANPQISFDPDSGRFFAIAVHVIVGGGSVTGSGVRLAVSNVEDATTWTPFALGSGDSTTEIFERPKIGVTVGKAPNPGGWVMISWNDFNTAHLGFMGASLAAFDKSAVVAASAGRIIPGASTGTTNQLFGVVPTRQLVADADAFAVYNLGGQNFIGALEWDGTRFKSAAIGITPTAPPPNALQPAGGTVIPGACNRPCVDTGDDRIQSAVWGANTLWASLNDACDPGGGVRACVRFAEFVVTDSSIQRVQDGDLGISGWDLYYPAVDMDGLGHLAAVVTASNEFAGPSLAETGQSISLTRTNPFQGVTLLDHVPTDATPPYVGRRWGDYSGAAIDPSNTGWVWVAGEETVAGTSFNWKTLLAPVSVANLGPNLGGTIAPPTLENLGCCLQLGSGPAASSWGPGRLDVFIRGTDNAIYHKWTATGGGGWSGWELQGGITMDGPAAVSWGPNHIDILVRGIDNQLWHKWWDGTSWNGWESLGGVLTSAPAVSTWGPGRLDVFARGTDDGLWHRWYTGGWSGWEPLGGVLSGGTGPGAVAWAPGRIDVVVGGTDAGVWHGWFDGLWHLYESLGGIAAGSPAISSWGPVRLDVWVQGPGVSTPGTPLYHRWYGGVSPVQPVPAWSQWVDQTGFLAGPPAAVSSSTEHQDVFFTGLDNNLYHSWSG